MTARQQIARLLPLVLLVVLIIAGLRGTVPTPRWSGPLRAYGVAIGIALEVVFCVLFIALRRREAAARRAALTRPYTAADEDIEPPQALRFTLSYVLGLCMLGIAGVLVANLHLHLFIKLKPLTIKRPHGTPLPKPLHSGGAAGGSLHIPWGPILYGLLIVVLLAAVAISIWWSTRLRRPAAPLVIEDVNSTQLAEAVAEGRAALDRIDDARAAIIACYLAMERSLAERGTARTVADTPDELLSRAVAAGTVRGGAAGSLTALFYEARFSTHPLGAGQRDAASAALGEIAAELAAKASEDARREAERTAAAQPPGQQAAGQQAAGQQAAGQQAARPGGGWV